MQASEKTLQHFAHSTMAPDVQARFTSASTQSLATQAHIEAQDTLSFDKYLAQWNNYTL
jgi:hypothetical protein